MLYLPHEHKHNTGVVYGAGKAGVGTGAECVWGGVERVVCDDCYRICIYNMEDVWRERSERVAQIYFLYFPV